MQHSSWRRIAASALTVFMMSPFAAQAALWTDIEADSVTAKSADAASATPRGRMLRADLEQLRMQMAAAVDDGIAKSAASFSVPMPDGSTREFRLQASDVMAPELAARYPEIATYTGTAVDDARVVGHFDVGPRGFHGVVHGLQQTVYVDPGEQDTYRAYFRKDMVVGERGAESTADSAAAREVLDAVSVDSKAASLAGDLRTYRLALATTGEYARYIDSSGNKSVILAELVNVVNRVNSVYERDLGIHLQLIAQEDALIFTNAALDPYDNSNGSSMMSVNTGAINLLVGAGAYDIGHVVSTGGGGLATIGVACNSGLKAAGVTGLAEPKGDAFYIDYVAHELGHQFGATHTFNSDEGQCGNGNRYAATAYEPGSGSTIMSYAGICRSDNLAAHSDDYFHAASFEQIVAYTRRGGGASCAAVASTGNRAPSVSVGAGGFTIPASTPFELTGSANDADGDAMSYRWEQMDLGDSGSTGPLFRSFEPTASPTRSFPRLEDVLSGDQTKGESLPASTRTLRFRFTAHDNRVAPDAAGVSSADLSFNVSDRAGPFRLLSPNGGGAVSNTAPLPVRWDVAGTDLAPVSCASVDIGLSTDDGRSFTLIAQGTPNDGSEDVTLPQLSSSSARIKIKCHDNVFFDISDKKFGISTTAQSASSEGSGGGGGAMGLPGLLVLAAVAALRRRSSAIPSKAA